MANLPTDPGAFTSTAPSTTALNNLAYMVSFPSLMPIVVSLKKSGTQSVIANTTTPVNWTLKELDSDGMWSVGQPSRLTAVTQGYYRVHATVAAPVVSGAVNNDYSAWFRMTTGVNNPAGAGTTYLFGGAAGTSSLNTGDFVSITLSSLTPTLYVADYVEVIYECSASVSMSATWLNTGNTDVASNGDGASCLYAYYVGEGP